MFGRWFGRKPKETTDGAPGRYRHGNNHLIELRSVVKTFETAAGTFTALKGVDLRVDAGEFLAVIGKSGSGKSTLINMITGIDRPSSGQVFVGDTAVHQLSEGQMAVWRGRNLGIIFQFFQLLPTLTVIENIMLPMDFLNMYSPRERRSRAMALLDQVEMTAHADKLPTAISGGQQQRVAIARAMANDPPILVADEPTGNLDSRTAEAVFQLFEQLVSQGKTILMVTHDIDLSKRVSRAVIVADGEIVNENVAEALPHLSVEQLGRIRTRFTTQRFRPGDIIIREGEPSKNFYILVSGAVEIVGQDSQEREIMLNRLEAGQYFGEIGLMSDANRSATVRAQTEVELAILDRVSFDELLNESQLTRADLDRIGQARAERVASTVSVAP